MVISYRSVHKHTQTLNNYTGLRFLEEKQMTSPGGEHAS